MNRARSFTRMLIATAFLSSLSSTATYADAGSPAITSGDTTPVVLDGSGGIKGRAYTSRGDFGLWSNVYIVRATPYMKWYFDRVFAEWENHTPNTPWPAMDDRAARAVRGKVTDEGGYFSFHGLPDGKYYIYEFGSWDVTSANGYSKDAVWMTAIETEDPVSVMAGKVTQLDRSDEREVNVPCPTDDRGIYVCDRVNYIKSVKF